MPKVRPPIFWSPKAEEDLIEIWTYLARESSDQVADDQLNHIERACATLEMLPYSGRPRDNLLPGVRSMLVHPYVVFYRVRNEAVEIIRVIHGRRDIGAIFAKASNTS
jgi:toxin ParE1/3/4